MTKIKTINQKGMKYVHSYVDLPTSTKFKELQENMAELRLFHSFGTYDNKNVKVITKTEEYVISQDSSVRLSIISNYR